MSRDDIPLDLKAANDEFGKDDTVVFEHKGEWYIGVVTQGSSKEEDEEVFAEIVPGDPNSRLPVDRRKCVHLTPPPPPPPLEVKLASLPPASTFVEKEEEKLGNVPLPPAVKVDAAKPAQVDFVE